MDLAIISRTTARRDLAYPGWSSWGLPPVVDMRAQRQLLVDRRQGCIVIRQSELSAIFGRRWAYTGNLLTVAIDSRLRRIERDVCELYYHESRWAPGFLTLDYIRSGPDTTLSTFYAATLVLDEIARLKKSSAIVANVTNSRISERLMERWNWQRHCLGWFGRHYIKRFYGQYPAIEPVWRERLGMESVEQ